MSDRIVIVSFHTPHYDFQAVGRTQVEAMSTLRRAWARHSEQTDADPVYLEENRDDVNYAVVKIPGALRDGNLMELVGPSIPRADVTPSVEAVIEFATHLPVTVGHPINEDRDVFDMDEVCDLLRHWLGIPAYVEYTGGGFATIYAGTPYRSVGEAGDSDEHPIMRYPALGGPGWFSGRMGHPMTVGVGSWEEFFVGPDDDTDSAPSLRDLAVTNTRQVVALLALHALGAADQDNVAAIGLDPTHRGIAPQNGEQS